MEDVLKIIAPLPGLVNIDNAIIIITPTIVVLLLAVEPLLAMLLPVLLSLSLLPSFAIVREKDKGNSNKP